MTDFKKYIDRRYRVEALQFVDPRQVVEILQLLRGENYTLKSDGYEFSIVVHNAEALEEKADVQVNRGDFLVRDHWGANITVVPRAEFYGLWEEDE